MKRRVRTNPLVLNRARGLSGPFMQPIGGGRLIHTPGNLLSAGGGGGGGGGNPPVLEDHATFEIATSGTTSRTMSLTIANPDNENQLLVLVGHTFGDNDAVSVTSCTFNGVEGTQALLNAVDEAGKATNQIIYYWKAGDIPASGAYNLFLQYPTSQHHWVMDLLLFSNVDQTTPLDTPVSVQSGTTLDNATLTTTQTSKSGKYAITAAALVDNANRPEIDITASANVETQRELQLANATATSFVIVGVDSSIETDDEDYVYTNTSTRAVDSFTATSVVVNPAAAA